jgi:hypothetical protein
LNERFVPVAVDNTRLQNQDDEEGQFLRLVSWQGQYQYSYARKNGGGASAIKLGCCSPRRINSTSSGVWIL